MFEEKTELFRKWLIEDKGLSNKTSGDIISRCKRLNDYVLPSIDDAVSSPESYLVALKAISSYALANKQDKNTQYGLISSLRSSIKKYCEYKNPNTFECYPNGHSLSR